MFAVRFHGRGGQGVVTSAEILSQAAFAEGRHAQAFPTFGSERTGAPVMAFCRLDDSPIRAHDPVTAPDAVVVQDPTLLHAVPVLAGTGPDSFVVINSARAVGELGVDALVEEFAPGRVVTVPATEIARVHLGRPMPGCVLLGAWSAQTGRVGLDPLCTAIAERFPGTLGAANAAAARAGFEAVLELRRRHAHA